MGASKKIFGFIFLSAFLSPAALLAVGSSGFENATFSSYAISQSNAVTARPNEPAAISYNPAGIADLKGIQIESNMAFESVITHNSDARGGSTQSAGTLIPVPTGYVTINPGSILNDRLTFGLGSDSPFGLTNKYDSVHPSVHYTGWRNWLKMYTLKPTVAVKITDWLSIGAGAMNYRVFNWGAIQAYPNILGGVAADGQVRVNLSGSAWGWHFGALLKPHPKHQLGFYLRSPVNIHTRGRFKVERSAFGGNFETGGYSDLVFPMNMTWAYAFLPTPRFSIETDFGYTRWSLYKRLDLINTDQLTATDQAIFNAIGTGNAKDYRDSFSIHLGGSYKWTDRLTLSAGSLFYTRAVPKFHYTPAVADGNRLAFSFGVGYKVNKYLTLETTYMNMLGLRTTVNNDISESLGTTVDGRYFSEYQIFLITARVAWEDIFDKNQKAPPQKEPEPDIKQLNDFLGKASAK